MSEIFCDDCGKSLGFVRIIGILMNHDVYQCLDCKETDENGTVKVEEDADEFTVVKGID